MRRLLAILLALLLPLQALAGLVMPIGHAVAVAAPVAAEGAALAAPTQAAHPCHEGMAMGLSGPMLPDDPAPAGHDLGCDACGLCHMASSGFAPAAGPIAAAEGPFGAWQAHASLAPASRIPPLLDRPPLTAAL